MSRLNRARRALMDALEGQRTEDEENGAAQVFPFRKYREA
jgi:hypothetical protein